MELPYIINIQKYSIHDGDGIRTTVFFKGCGLRCLWCHNPESQSFEKELMFSDEKCVGCGSCSRFCPEHAIEIESDGKAHTNPLKCVRCGECSDFCLNDAREMTGKQYTVPELLKELEKDRIFYEQSGGGVTLSGGEVMAQNPDYIESLAKALKNRGISVVIDTCGFAPFENLERILPYTDMFLYDVKHIDPEMHRKFTGQSNELILENLKKLSDRNAPINIRIPTVEGVNADDISMGNIIAFLKDNIKVAKLNLLPYHNTGSHKYRKLSRESVLFSAPSAERMEELKRRFENAGFQNVKIGG